MDLSEKMWSAVLAFDLNPIWFSLIILLLSKQEAPRSLNRSPGLDVDPIDLSKQQLFSTCNSFHSIGQKHHLNPKGAKTPVRGHLTTSTIWRLL